MGIYRTHAQGTFAWFGTSRVAATGRGCAILCGILVALTSVPATGQTDADIIRRNQIRLEQEMLIWTTHYEALIDGIEGDETIKAKKKFQESLGNPPTGYLTAAEEKALIDRGIRNKRQAGFRTVTDPDAGVSVGIPGNWITETKKTKWGTHYYGKAAGLAIDTLRFGEEISFVDLYNRLKRINNRGITYDRFVDGRWFVIAAYEGDAAVYVRAEVINLPNQRSEIRGFSIWMSKTRPVEYESLAPAMLSSFSTKKFIGGPLDPDKPPPKPALILPPNPPPLSTRGQAASLEECFRGLGPGCPPILTFR